MTVSENKARLDKDRSHKIIIIIIIVIIIIIITNVYGNVCIDLSIMLLATSLLFVLRSF